VYKEQKSKAIKLRLNGFTYSEITTKLRIEIPKSTLSGWFKNLKYSKNQEKILSLKIKNKIRKSQKKGLKNNKNKPA